MISMRLVEAFSEQIAVITKKIATDRARLAKLQGEEAALCGIEIQTLEKLLTEYDAAQNALFAADGRAVETVAKFKKWRTLVLECRRLKEEVASLGPPLQRAEEELALAKHAVITAQSDLSNHKSRPLQDSDYPTVEETAKWNARSELLEAVVQARISARTAKQDTFGELSARHGTAARAFDSAAFTERVSRLPGPAAPERGVGELNPVSESPV